MMVDDVRTPEVHIMFDSNSYDVTFDALDIGDMSTDAQIREKVAAYLDVPIAKLAEYAIDRNPETGDITLRPQAVFGMVMAA